MSQANDPTPSESSASSELPRAPIDRIVEPLTRFLHVEAASGGVLLVATIAALVLANSSLSEGYLALWKTELGWSLGGFEMSHSLQHWVNDGLMAIFFFVIGLEVKREVVLGELQELRKAALPIAAALGGMIVPAGVYLALQVGEPTASGWGIPMATDIAFVVGCMAVLGRRIPPGLRILLLSLAIADDIGAILVIAIAYTDSVDFRWLALAAGAIGVTAGMARLGVRRIPVYLFVGGIVWLGFHESGVHATIAGVILGLMTPARSTVSPEGFGRVLARARTIFDGGRWGEELHPATEVRQLQRLARETVSPLVYLEQSLHPWTGFLIVPIFALANAGVRFELADFAQPVAVAAALGLFIGKPLGVVGFSFLAVRARIASLPAGVSWGLLTAGAFLTGIGFTMALFVAGLALDGSSLDAAKVGVLGGSALAAAVGLGLMLALPAPPKASAPSDP